MSASNAPPDQRRAVPREGDSAPPDRMKQVPDTADIVSIDPFDLLLNPGRFDLPAKYIYARHRQRNIASDWAPRLYAEHIRAFNKFREGKPPVKSGIEAFVSAFDAVLDDVGANGFDNARGLVPVNHDGTVLDGAHRIAACALHGVDVQAVEIDRAANYNYAFFRRKGLAQEHGDAIALEYCRLNPKARIVNLFPAAVGGDDEVRKILSDIGDIYYEKDVYLGQTGAANYIRRLYEGERWADPRTGGRGVARKTQRCFGTTSNPLRVMVVACESVADLKHAKELVRKHYGIGKHAIHIDDTHEQAVSNAGLLLNSNSLDLLNTARPRVYRNFEQRLRAYRDWLRENGFDNEDFCVDGSSVLSVYGIREANDLDFLYAGAGPLARPPEKVDLHNEHAGFYPVSVDEIVYDPANHFRYGGLKFVSLDLLRQMKVQRGDAKDATDVAAIDAARTGRFKADWNLVARQKFQRLRRKVARRISRRRR